MDESMPMVQGQMESKRSYWYSPHSLWRSLLIRPRLYVAAGIGVGAFLLLPASLPGAIRETTAWCGAELTYLILAFRVIAGCHSDKIKMRAALQDDSGTVILVMIVLAVTASLLAIAGLLTDAKTASDGSKLLYVLAAASTIVISWTVIQVVFTLHYAHEYYAPHNIKSGAPAGLDFPHEKNPDYWDFFYFATSIGATSQTSDVAIVSKTLRRLATLHAVVAFFFNTMVLALAINLAASMV